MARMAILVDSRSGQNIISIRPRCSTDCRPPIIPRLP
jgi:hypothetical protein